MDPSHADMMLPTWLLASTGETEMMLQTMVIAIAGSIFLIIFSHRLHIPAIVTLLCGGVVLGPQVMNIVQPASLGDGLLVIVSLAVGLILFEGGLTLNLKGYKTASGMIGRLLTVGVLVTWLATAAAAKLIFDLELSLAILSGAMVIVTGPTVITPILKRIRIHPKLNHILHWESVLIDPIGVFVAILCFEWLSGQGSGALANFGLRVAIGLGVGAGGGLMIFTLIRYRIVPDDMMNILALASAVLIFGVAEHFASEAGLLAVTVAGFLLGLWNPLELKEIRRFKSEITDLAIGMLFILLSARLEFSQFQSFGWSGLLLVGVVMFLIRPINIAVSSVGFKMSWQEKTFLSWLAPRGIVAASMASLFALRLKEMHDKGLLPSDPKFIETFTYSVIIATVILQGFTAGPLASLLKLKAPLPTGWLVVGAHHLGRRVASFLQQQAERTVILLDTNGKAVAEARRDGVTAFVEDARDVSIQEREEMQPVGNMLALTDNVDLNLLLCQRWSESLGKNHVYLWAPSTQTVDARHPGRVVWAKLPRPSLISGELARGEAVTMARDELRRGWSYLGDPILASVGKKVDFNPSDTEPDEEDKSTPALYLRREADYLSRSLRTELVMHLDVADQETLFAQMVAKIVQLFHQIDRERTVHELQERERSFPTAMGHGIAIPHAYADGLDARVCAVAKLATPIPFGAMDGKDVSLVFLLLSPKGDPEGHLATVAEIARLASDEKLRDGLMQATTPEALLLRLRGVGVQ